MVYGPKGPLRHARTTNDEGDGMHEVDIQSDVFIREALLPSRTSRLSSVDLAEDPSDPSLGDWFEMLLTDRMEGTCGP